MGIGKVPLSVKCKLTHNVAVAYFLWSSLDADGTKLTDNHGFLKRHHLKSGLGQDMWGIGNPLYI